MTNTTNTTNNETNYIDPIDKFVELRISLQTTAGYQEALREAAAAALDNYMSTWETSENPDTFRNHVLGCGRCDALEVLVEWANVNCTSLDLLLAEHPYLVAENEELES
uniref:hypothetical protein n=1 Tax=Microbulbifer agarilyticus TaxID=260552 RepID=UPI0002559176|nr:hypothetical protein [Microbulbifer agarilyticus]